MTSDVPGERLATPVERPSDLAHLDQADLQRLARWVSASLLAAERPPGGRARRVLVLGASTVAAAFMVPWVLILARTLPDRVQTHEWGVAWVGFDVAMLLAFAATAWFGWRRRQLVMSALLVTATLLLCDAWFDLTLSWGTNEHGASIATAVLAEVPAAIFLLVSYGRVLRELITQVRHGRGDFGPAPSLWRQPLLLYSNPQRSLDAQDVPTERSGDTP